MRLFSQMIGLLFFITLLFTNKATSQVSITKPNLSINVCTGYPSAYNALGNIVIAETANNNFSTGTGVTLVLTAPTNFQFQAGTGAVSVTGSANLSAASVVVTASTITVTYTCGGTNKTDSMTISGIMVRATTTASTGNITRTSGTGTINGLVNSTTLTNTLASVTGTTPTISSQPVATSACTNTSTSFSVTASGVSTYQWQRNGVNLSNVAPYSNVATATLNITNPATTDAGNFTCVLNASTCPTTSSSVALTVNAIPVITTQPSTPAAICAGLASTSLSVTATGATTYQWRKNGVNLTNVAPYSNVTTATLNITNPAFSENGASFDVVVRNAALCSVISTARTLTVNPISVISSQPVATSACTNTTATFSITASNVTTYQWQRNGVNLTNVAPYSNVTTATLTITNPAVGIAGNFTCVLNSATCPVTSSSVALTVNTIPVITTQPATPATMCEGAASPSLSVVATGATTYQWRKNGINLTNTAPYSNVTTTTLNITTPSYSENGASLDVLVGNAAGCSVASTARVLTINAVSVISVQPVATSACTNTTATFSITASNVTTYQWQRNGVNLTNGVPYSGVTTATLTITNPAVGIAGNFTCILNSATCLVTSSTVALTVNAIPVITTQPVTPAAICENASTNFSVTATGATTYQWRKNGVNLTNVAPYSNVTTATLDVTNPPFSENGASFDVVVGNGSGCSVLSNARTLTVKLLPIISVQPVATSACTNGTTTFSITASNVLTYQWLRNGLIISNGAPYSGVTTSTLTITNPGAGNAGNFTCVLNNATCPVTSSAAALVVNAIPVITVQPATPASVCGSAVRTISVTATGATTYQWRKNGVNLTNVAPYSNVTTATLSITNPAVSENGASFDVVVGNAAPCTVTSNAVTLTVNPVSVISIQPIPTSVCTNTTATLSINATNVTTYQWQRNGVNLTNTAPYSNVTTSILTITNPATTDAGNFSCVINSATCLVTSSIVAVTVNAIPVISVQPATPAPVCAGINSTSLTVNASGGPTYQWRKNGVNLTNTAPYSNVTTATLNITNPSSSENGAVLDVVLTNGAGCTVTSVARVLTVNPVPAISAQPVATSACTNTSAFFSITTTNTVTYQWRRNGVNLTNVAPYSNVTTATLTITNPATTDAGNFSCILNSATCPVTSSSVALTVNAIPVITTQPTTPAAVCAGAGVRTLTVVATGATTYQWRKNGVNLTNVAPYSTVNTAILTITNPAASENGASFDVVVGNAAGCNVTSVARTLSVNSAPSNVNTPSPANNSTGNCYAGTGAVNTIYWAANASATSYDVYFGAGAVPGVVTANVATNSYTTGALAASTTYYWKVVAKNSCGSAAGPSVWNFTTKAGGTCYCVPTASSGVHGTGITNVTYSTVNNTTSNTTVFNDYSSLVGSALQGSSMPISVTTATASNNYNINVWVDWNNNGDFVDAGESVFSGQVNSNTINGTIAIPLTATVGNHRMRVGIVKVGETAIPCFTGVRGAFEDYTLSITAAAACTSAPSVATNPVDSSIANGGTTSFTASFINSPASYIWEISTDGGYNFSTLTTGGVYTGATTATLTITAATGNMDGFVYRVSASNACGTSGVSAQATLTVTTTYCTPSSTSGTLYLTGVYTDGNLGDNANVGTTYSAGGYGNYSAIKIATQIPGGGINLSISLSGLHYAWAYVDWNGDGDFTDSGEAFYYSKYGIISTTIGIVVPTNQALGNYRLRIRTRSASASSSPSPTACAAYTDGETEDYTITVVPPCAAIIQSVTNGSVCGTNLPVTMSAVGLGGATKYRWYTTATGGTYEAETTTGSYSPTLSVTTIYYVTAYNGSCESLTRTRVVATVIPVTDITFNPAAPVTCGENTVITISSDLNDVAVLDLFYETFETGGLGGFTYTTGAIPVSPGADTPWTVKTNTYQSTTTDVWRPAISSGAIGTYFALTSSDYSGTSNNITRLTTTSPIDATGYLDLTLAFDHYYSFYGGTPDNIKVQVSTDNGVNFTDIVTYTSDQGSGTDFKNETIDLSSYVNQTQLKLRFQYTANWKDGWAIDNVRFYGTKQLNPTFSWSSATPVAGYIDYACTTPYVSQAVTSIYLKPTLAQLESGSFPITVTSTLASGCPTTKVITVTNNSRIWKGTNIADPTEWNDTSNWLPAIVPSPDNCVIIPNTTIISGTGFKAYAKNLTVKSTGNLEIQSSNFLTVTDFVKVDAGGVLTVRNNGSLIQENDAAINQGTISMDRLTTVRKLDYVYWSSPVASYSAASLSPDTNPYYIFKWNPAIPNSNNGQGNWVSGNEIMTAGKGYIVRGPDTYSTTPAAYVGTLTGTPFNGIIQNSITRGDITSVAGTYPAAPYAGTNGVTITANTDNWNLVGNPYPSAIDALDFITYNAVTTGTIVGNVRVWTHGTNVSTSNSNAFYSTYGYNYSTSDYINYNGTGPSIPGFDGYIGAGQGFFVLMNEAPTPQTSTVTFNNSMRSDLNRNDQFYRNDAAHAASNSLNATERNRVWLSLVDPSNTANTTLVGYVSGATLGEDVVFDAPHKIGATSSIYSLIDNNPMIIQGRPTPFNPSDTVPLGVLIPSNGIYNIAISKLDGLFDDTAQGVYVEDTALGIIHDLRTGPYAFSAVAGTFNSRFVLRYTTSALGVHNPTNDNQTFAFIASNQLQVQSIDSIKEVTIYDITGKLVQTYKPSELKTQFKTDFYFANGAYIAKIKLDNGTIVSKKLLN